MTTHEHDHADENVDVPCNRDAFREVIAGFEDSSLLVELMRHAHVSADVATVTFVITD